MISLMNIQRTYAKNSLNYKHSKLEHTAHSNKIHARSLLTNAKRQFKIRLVTHAYHSHHW
jgi:hypothetical protein